MKKLVIFLIPLIVSISAYAKEKSSFTEDFSLVKYSGDNIRKVFEIDIFSERTALSRIATVENRNQKRGNRYNLIYELQENISSEEESESLAEFYLKRTAERSKKRRKTGGTIGIVVGGGLIAWGASLTSKEQEGWFDLRPIFGYYSIIMGAGCVVGGALALAVPSRAERELDDVLSISDRAQRKKASHKALSFLAARGRRNRILAGILSAAYAVGSLVGKSPEYAYTAPYAALAVYSFVMKSPAERAFQNYLKEREIKQRKELALRVGIMPYGGVKISLALSF